MQYRALFAAALVLMPAAAHARSPAPTIEERLQRVEDELAIKRLIMQYAVLLDARDFDGYVNLFAENGVWQNGPVVKHGRGEIRAMLVDIYGEPEPGYANTQSYRIVHNIEVRLDGDRATARSRQLTIMRGEDGAPVPRLSGIYEDELIRENGEWKFLRRTDSVFMPTPAEWRAQMEAMRAEQAKE